MCNLFHRRLLNTAALGVKDGCDLGFFSEMLVWKDCLAGGEGGKRYVNVVLCFVIGLYLHYCVAQAVGYPTDLG